MKYAQKIEVFISNFSGLNNMNFMPSEDAFFDEPIHSNDHGGYPPPVLGISHRPNTLSAYTDTVQKSDNILLAQILESSKKQEQFLEKIVGELGRLNQRMSELERISHTPSAPVSVSTNRVPNVVGSPTNMINASSGMKPTRGSLVLPPGSKVPNAPNLPERKSGVPMIDETQAKEDEQAAILRRRAEEEARIARLEQERKQREEEEERKRLEEQRRLEEEKRRKQELESKTKGLMTGIFTDSSGGLFGPDDDLDVSTNPGGTGSKPGRGLFDD